MKLEAPCVLTVLLLGCSRERVEPRADPVTKPAPSPTVAPAPSKPNAVDWSCKVDKDCITSCGWGAVNADWYRKTQPRDCDDGCEMADAITCESGICTAWTRAKGDAGRTVNVTCTRRTKAIFDD